MADTRETNSFFELLKKFTNQIYFLRFPILTVVALAGLPYLGLFSDLQSLLASLFVSDAWGIFLVSSVAFTTAGAILVTWRLIAAHGEIRFNRSHQDAETTGGHSPTSPSFNIQLWQALLAGLSALPVTIAVVYQTWTQAPEVSRAWAVLAAVFGLIAALVLFFFAALAQLLVNSEGRSKQLARELFIVRWLPESLIDRITRADPVQAPRLGLRKLLQLLLGPGYFDESAPSSSGGRFLPGHGLALALFIISALIFIIAGQFSSREMPALFFVVLLLMLLCWGLSGLSFLLDRYRVPVLTIILLIGYFTSPNYYYAVDGGKTLTPLTPKEVIGAGAINSRRIIVVAAEGGGIQAAAWTARVLTGLQSQFPEFGQAVRVVSSVSGGSVGALFFVNGYNRQTGVPENDALEPILKMAEGNSLDAVARGLVYHDFIHTLIPWWEAGDDRGTALQSSWTVNCQKVCEEFLRDNPGKVCPVNCAMTDTLAGWADDVRAGKRPANIFNGTIVESGDRLLITNSDIEKPLDRGRVNVRRLLGGKDVQAATSARLSAAFPYVSPAARADAEDPFGAKLHVVDGGYYDNYGMTSLVEWLNAAFINDLLDSVLVIQIQNFDDGSRCNQPPVPPGTPSTGYISQLLATLLTLLHIRTAAQASHKELEYALLREKYGEKHEDQEAKSDQSGKIKNALFKFRCGPAPLTWKLTEDEKNRIAKCWDEQYVKNTCPDIGVVKQFLEEMIQPGNQAAATPASQTAAGK
jgi:hypothetical protein